MSSTSSGLPSFEPATAVNMARMRSIESIAQALFDAEAAAVLERPAQRPGATYRLQLHAQFRFDQVTAIVSYLNDLGITDVYLSPYLRAKPGSTHGYDVFDHDQINPEIGDEQSNAQLSATLARHGMGRVLDVVPNHMGIAGPNPYWMDVLEVGQQSPSARFFDIDWNPIKDELNERVLLPILEDQYGRVLEAGLLRLERDEGSFRICYHDNRLPVAPRSYALILGRRMEEFHRRFNLEDEHAQEYLSICSAADNLPPRGVLTPSAIETKLREKEVIKRRLARLCREQEGLRQFLDENVAGFAGRRGEPESFDALHNLLENQVYRLAYWRVAADEINYRRFFDINDLAGLRVEDRQVFEVVHSRVLNWVASGGVTALRIDHPDGLADPTGYFRRVQEAVILLSCHRRYLADEMGPEHDWPLVADTLRRLYRDAADADPTAPIARRFPILVEKILSRGEELPPDWTVDGTVGYEYLNVLNGLFVEPGAAAAVEACYVELTDDHEPFVEVLYDAKQLIMRSALSSELNMLARLLNQISESDRHSRDFTLNELRRALREVMACFPVYRTYLYPGRPLTDQDRAWIQQAIARAARRNLTTDDSVFNFLRDALMLEHPGGLSLDQVAQRERFAIRFQQSTGPVQAKGLEDTAFYRQVKLASLNEVGADPMRFSASSSNLHAINAHRLRHWPGGLSPTATHDTKRGEDTRLRINVLSEVVDEWKLHLGRWIYWNARYKKERDGGAVPDSREELLFYQTLIGTWPFAAGEESPPDDYVMRLQRYMVKAVREAKRNTSWTDADPTYVEMIEQFVEDVLQGSDNGPFLRDFVPFQKRIARVAVVHGLSQALLKLTSPGVPDIYQGTELWDLSLVDPDNRQPVDYALRQAMLRRLRERLQRGEPRSEVAAQALAAPEDGLIKLYLCATVLGHRRDNRALFAQGSYRPLEAEGPRKGNVVAFVRGREGQSAMTIVTRLACGMMGNDAQVLPLGAAVWDDTRVLLPSGLGQHRWRDLLTGRMHEVKATDAENPARLSLGAVLDTLPVALLVSEPEATS